jgi:hypothetical protein
MKHPLIPVTALLLAFACGLGAADAAAVPIVEIGTWKVAVTIPKPPVAGKPLDVDLVLTPATSTPKAVRLWVGKADARGSVKVKAEPEAAGTYCVGVEVPTPIPAEAQVWIAIEAADGTTSKASVALPVGDGK